jgi:PPOX class probable F420-dependent enzyme
MPVAPAMPLIKPVTIPDSHRDLLIGQVHGVLATMLPDGQPQVSIVWVDYNGTHVLINTTLERQKGRNMRANPKVALLVIDPQDASRWIEVWGRVVEMRRAGAEAHADTLTRRYTSKRHFYGDIYPVEQRRRETRVIVLIEPLKVSLDAIFK